METITEKIGSAEALYLPKGRDSQLYKLPLQKLGVTLPDLSNDTPRLVTDTTEFLRIRSADALNRVRRDSRRTVAIVGSDVCATYIDSDSLTDLEYEEFGTDGDPTCTYELLIPKDPEGGMEAFLKRLRGEGKPLRIVTGMPFLLGKLAADKGWNVEVTEDNPEGSVEIIARSLIDRGEADAAADLVTSGASAEIAGFFSSKSMGQKAPVDPILKSIYGAVVWRKPNAEYRARRNLNDGIDQMDATLVDRYKQVGNPDAPATDTIRLLGSIQKALAKTVEEGLELAIAGLTSEGNIPTTAELADRVRAEVLFINSIRASKGQTPITFRDFLEVLVGRNQPKP